MVFSNEDEVQIESLYELKGYNVRQNIIDEAVDR